MPPPPPPQRNNETTTGITPDQPEQLQQQFPNHTPPRFTVDLSVPPEHRYDHVARHMRDSGAIEDADINALFSDLLDMITPFDFLNPLLPFCIKAFARFALRRVYTDEETAELKGIVRETNIPLFLLVAFNVLLDLLLGCTTGGVRVGSNADEGGDMVHFRTLDWGMDTLRYLVVELDFVRTKGGPVVATTVGYFGYVGVLTGVRPGLSMSLNHRATHDRSGWLGWWKSLRFRWHQVMVVFGRRPSISSTLRHYLLTPVGEVTMGQDMKIKRWKSWGGLEMEKMTGTDGTSGGEVAISQGPPGTEPENPYKRKLRKRKPASSAPSPISPPEINIEAIISFLTKSPSTAAYLIFCTPDRVYSLEMDNRAIISMQTSDEFLVTTNHDVADEGHPEHVQETAAHQTKMIGMEEIIAESTTRKAGVLKRWEDGKIRREKRRRNREGVKREDVLELLNHNDVTCELTHYAVVMEPKTGRVVWRRVYDVLEEESSEGIKG
ncbi:hypothetical protein B0H66DRAFT_559965 [Apodospora peruviana]|uniref:ceramidase n=1 Tax=Apodospora peruviana TaxID=516989 RepID=A0AAE0HZV4_9PEZI|nr:hypothetical protein B0H66DRAFT_559965 [Apodospora peruviana]